MQKRLTKIELKKLRRSLPAGSVELISWKTGLAESSIRQILLKSDRFNPIVIAIAISIAEKSKAQFIELKNKLKAIA
nr:hypothetical protein [Pedobacter sp. ASV19]